MMKTFLIFFVLMVQGFLARSDEMPHVPNSPQEDEKYWNDYCKGNRQSTDIPVPNYSNSDINSAVRRLTMVSPFSYYFYSGPLYAYNLKNGKELVEPPANFPKVPEVFNGKKNAHAFLTLLCGEFRDRPSLIHAKIKWVQKMITLPETKQKSINLNADLWKQVSAQSYNSYLTNSRLIFSAKQTFLKNTNQRAIMGKYNEDFPIEPFTICETKFIFKRYVEYNAVFGQPGANARMSPSSKNKRSIANDPAPAPGAVQAGCVAEGGSPEFCSGKADSPEASNAVKYIQDLEIADGEVDPPNNNGAYTAEIRKLAKPLRDYLAEYNRFKGRCLDGDLDHFYDFRGDSNFKPNSPESNGMIWYSSTIANSCMRKDGQLILKEKSKDKFADPAICEKYFRSPFKYRWSAARAGLATWMLRDAKHDGVFANSNSPVVMIPHLDPMTKPFGFRMKTNKMAPLSPYYTLLVKNAQGQVIGYDSDTGKEKVLEGADLEKALKEEDNHKKEYDTYLEKYNAELANHKPDETLFDFDQNWQSQQTVFWKRADLGFNDLVSFGGGKKDKPNVELAYERIRDAVNRHTDWYSSGYDDGQGTIRDQAYSPFVASSYEMSASNGFTAPGVTVQSPSDGCKHWMFVFKLKKDQWYTTRSINEKIPFDFNRHWFDETSLGTNSLADSERALDRLGTALEGEMDSILYLHKLTTSGTVDPKCGEEAIRTNYMSPTAPAPAASAASGI